MILKPKQKEEKEGSMIIPIDNLQPFHKHPYKVLDNEDMERLMESIKENGVITPILVSHIDIRRVKYDIISGHRRFEACKRLGITEIPAIYKEMSYEEAVIAMVDSNLQREHILPSEKAKAYQMKMEALRCQGKRSDLTSDQVGPKLTANKISDSESASQVKRFIRLNHLIPKMLELVDEGKIALSPAVELSYLTKEEQENLLTTIESEDCTPSFAQAKQMRNLSLCRMLSIDQILDIMSKPKANQKEVLKMPLEKVRAYSPKVTTIKEAEEFISKACDYYTRYLQRQRGRDR